MEGGTPDSIEGLDVFNIYRDETYRFPVKFALLMYSFLFVFG